MTAMATYVELFLIALLAAWALYWIVRPLFVRMIETDKWQQEKQNADWLAGMTTAAEAGDADALYILSRWTGFRPRRFRKTKLPFLKAAAVQGHKGAIHALAIKNDRLRLIKDTFLAVRAAKCGRFAQEMEAHSFHSYEPLESYFRTTDIFQNAGCWWFYDRATDEFWRVKRSWYSGETRAIEMEGGKETPLLENKNRQQRLNDHAKFQEIWRRFKRAALYMSGAITIASVLPILLPFPANMIGFIITVPWAVIWFAGVVPWVVARAYFIRSGAQWLDGAMVLDPPARRDAQAETTTAPQAPTEAETI